MQKLIHMKTKVTNYAGENIYVGLDVHKNNWKVTIMTDHLTHKSFVQSPLPDNLVNYLKDNFPRGNYHSAYEAGFAAYGYTGDYQH